MKAYPYWDVSYAEKADIAQIAARRHIWLTDAAALPPRTDITCHADGPLAEVADPTFGEAEQDTDYGNFG